jgi:hypothetical protein
MLDNGLILTTEEQFRSILKTVMVETWTEFESKRNESRLCNVEETRELLGGISGTKLGVYQSKCLLLPAVGGGKGSTRLFRYTDIISFINRKKK